MYMYMCTYMYIRQIFFLAEAEKQPAYQNLKIHYGSFGATSLLHA